MKKFKFALQAVLDQRQRLEDEKQLIVADRKRAVAEAEAELARFNQEFRSHTIELREHHREWDVETLRLYYAHLSYLDRAIVAQIRVVAERRVALDRARNELLAASKEKKVVEKLKSRRREAFLIEEMRIEQNELDDGNARRYGRAAVGGTP